MNRIGALALTVFAIALPAAAMAASCDTQLSDVHIVREKGSPTTFFRANVTKGTCDGAKAPTHVKLYANGRSIAELAIPKLAPGASGPISVALPPNVDLNTLGVGTGDGNHAAVSPVVAIKPIVRYTPAPNAFTGSTDIRPQSAVIHLLTSGAPAAR